MKPLRIIIVGGEVSCAAIVHSTRGSHTELQLQHEETNTTVVQLYTISHVSRLCPLLILASTVVHYTH